MYWLVVQTLMVKAQWFDTERSAEEEETEDCRQRQIVLRRR